MGRDTVKWLHGVLWGKYSGILRSKRKYIPILSHHVYIDFTSDILLYITHWHTLIWLGFESLHSGSHPGNYLTVVGFIPSQVPLGTRARGETAVPRGRCQEAVHISFQQSSSPNITLTLFCCLNIWIHCHLNKHGVQFICSDCMELFDYVWIRIPCYKSQFQVPAVCCWSSL